jgi:hypothetical protein
MKNMTKKHYEPPTLEVIYVKTEGTIADSGEYKVTLQDWETDNTSAPYDGDIWLEI